MNFPIYLAATSAVFGDYHWGFKVLSDKDYLSYSKTGKTARNGSPNGASVLEVVDQEIKNKNLKIISAAEAALLFGEV